MHEYRDVDVFIMVLRTKPVEICVVEVFYINIERDELICLFLEQKPIAQLLAQSMHDRKIIRDKY